MVLALRIVGEAPNRTSLSHQELSGQYLQHFPMWHPQDSGLIKKGEFNLGSEEMKFSKMSSGNLTAYHSKKLNLEHFTSTLSNSQMAKKTSDNPQYPWLFPASQKYKRNLLFRPLITHSISLLNRLMTAPSTIQTETSRFCTYA